MYFLQTRLVDLKRSSTSLIPTLLRWTQCRACREFFSHRAKTKYLLTPSFLCFTSSLPPFSSFPFKVGSIYPSRETLVAEWVQHNHFLSRGTQVVKCDLAKGKFISNCISCPKAMKQWFAVNGFCQCHLIARRVNSPCKEFAEAWEIISVNLIHSCTLQEGRRQREYKSAIIETLSAPLQGYIPNQKAKGGCAHLVSGIVQQSSGFDVKKPKPTTSRIVRVTILRKYISVRFPAAVILPEDCHGGP